MKMIEKPKLHVLSEGEKVFTAVLEESVLPREGEIVIFPGSNEGFEVRNVEHIFSSYTSVEGDKEYSQDVYLEVEGAEQFEETEENPFVHRPKLHLIVDGKKVINRPCREAAFPQEGELLIPPDQSEEVVVSNVEHLFSSDETDDETSFTQDVYIETRDTVTPVEALNGEQESEQPEESETEGEV